MSKNGIDKLIKEISKISNKSEWNKIKTRVEDNVLSEEDIVYIFNWISDSDSIFEKIDVGKLSDIVELMRNEYAGSEEVEASYLRLYKRMLSEESDEEEVLDSLEQEFVRFIENQKSDKVAITYLDILPELFINKRTDSQINDVLEKGEKVYEGFRSSEDVVASYLNFLSKFLSTKLEGSQSDELLKKGEKVYKEFQSSEKVVVSYLKFLYRAPVNNSSISLFKNIEKRIKEEYRNSSIIYLVYLQCLLKMSSKELKLETLEKIEKKADEYSSNSVNNRELKEIAIEYVKTLALISSYKNDFKEIQTTVDKIEKYIDVDSSDEMKTTYITLLMRLSEMDPAKDERKKIAEKVKNLIPDKINGNNFFMSLFYLAILRNLSVKQNKKNELKETRDEAKKVETSLSSFLPNTWPDYIQIDLNYALSLNDRKTQEYVKDILSQEDISRETIEKVYDQLIAIKTDTVKQRKKFSILIKELFEKFYKDDSFQFTKKGKDNSSQSTKKGKDDNSQSAKKDQYYSSRSIKYRVLYELTENMSEEDKDILIDIFILVQQVKYRLIVKKPKELRLAHYTSGRVLQIYLNQKDNEKNNPNTMPDTMAKAMADAMAKAMPNAIANAMAKAMPNAKPNITANAITNAITNAMPNAIADAMVNAMPNTKTNAIPYAIKTKSRLCNVNYMNDPSEGNVLDQYLEWGTTSEQLSLRPRPWFLMCLTTSIDNLTMWAQYGEKAEGVCVVLDSGDFSEVSSLADIEWFTMNKNPFDIFSSVSLPNNTEPKDFIYRIGYLSIQKNNSMNLDLKFNAGLCEEEVEKINESLETMKNTINTINNNSELFEKVDKFLEEIRYLFKSADYSYESELRLLKYSPLESDNKNIKIDDSDGVAKLYIERDNPIRIKEVIFGPKFSNPENVTPLLQLLDKNIKFSQSKIPFK